MMLNSKLLGNKIASARKKVNLSQSELAGKISISPQAVGKWERGESLPDIMMLNRLAHLFGVDLNYFSDSFQMNENNPPGHSTSHVSAETGSKPEKRSVGHWDMSEGNWVDADFSGLKNLKEKFNSSNIRSCKFIEADLSGLILKNNFAENSDFSSSDLRNSQIINSKINRNIFADCLLTDSVFEKSEIKNCDFARANLLGVQFLKTNFQGNTLDMTLLSHTAFKESEIADVVYNGIIENCSFEDCTFKNVKFEKAVIVNSFFKHNKKLNHVHFMDCKADKITYAFLKSGKADLSGIAILE